MTRRLVARAERAGFSALFVTVDDPIRGKRRFLSRSPMKPAAHIQLASTIQSILVIHVFFYLFVCLLASLFVCFFCLFVCFFVCSFISLFIYYLPMSSAILHPRTVVRECFRGDDESQWERGKFDPPPSKNPSIDGHQNLCG